MPAVPDLVVPEVSMPSVSDASVTDASVSDGRVVLRKWRLTDADIAAVVQAACDPDIARFSSVGSATSNESATAWIRSRDEPDRLDWAITTPTAIMGRVSLAHIDHVDGVGEVGYWLLPDYRGQGVAAAAVGMVERHAFDTIGLERLIIRHELDNERSCLLAQRRGYLEEGTQRGAFARRGRRQDLHVHARLVTDPAVP